MTDLNARLRAAIERALECVARPACNPSLEEHGYRCPARHVAAVLAAARAQIAEAQRDTARLDWLAGQPVDCGDSDTGPVYSTHCAEPDCTHLHDPNLRSAIDAARATEGDDD